MAARRALVIGGTGFLGRRIAGQLAARGDEVTVLSRHRQPAFEHLSVDRRDRQALRAALRGRAFDVVVDNIAYDGADVAGTLDALAGQAGHYLLTSSAAVYPDRYVRRPLREAQADLSTRMPADAPDAFHPRLGQAYGNGKRDAERTLMAGGVPWTIVRAPVVVGADDRTLRAWWFVQRLLDGGPIMIPDWGPGRVFQVVWVDDLARAFGLAAASPAAYGRTYNVAQAELFTAETWLLALAAALGRPASAAHIPESEVAVIGLPGYAMPIAGRPFGHLLLDTAAIRCDLGFEPVDESIWLAHTAADCAADPPPEASPGYERRAAEVDAASRRGVTLL